MEKIARTFKKATRLNKEKTLKLYEEKIIEIFSEIKNTENIEYIADLIRLCHDLGKDLGYSSRDLHYAGLKKALNFGRFKIISKKS